MRRIAIAVVAWALALSATAFQAEVYIHIPGDKPVHCLNAEVRWINGAETMVEIKVPWGISYITHMANVVIAEREKK